MCSSAQLGAGGSAADKDELFLPASSSSPRAAACQARAWWKEDGPVWAMSQFCFSGPGHTGANHHHAPDPSKQPLSKHMQRVKSYTQLAREITTSK